MTLTRRIELLRWLTATGLLTAGQIGSGSEDRSGKFLAALEDHRALLYQIIRTYAPDKDGWQDLEQEIILQLWRAFPRYDGSVALSTWMYRIAFNVTVTDYRKRKRRAVGADYTSIFRRTQEADPVRAERTERLYAAIRQLSPRDRSVILLHLDGHDYDRIAGIVGVSRSNVGTLLNRIRGKLKTILHRQ